MECSKCKRNLSLVHDNVESERTESFVGMIFIFKDMNQGFFEVYPELKDRESINICYICWIESFGIKIN